MYKKVDTNLNFVEREKEIREFWKAHDIAQKAIDQREGLSLIHISEPTRLGMLSRMPSSA